MAPNAARIVLGEGHIDARQVALSEDRDVSVEVSPQVSASPRPSTRGSVQVAISDGAPVSDREENQQSPVRGDSS